MLYPISYISLNSKMIFPWCFVLHALILCVFLYWFWGKNSFHSQDSFHVFFHKIFAWSFTIAWKCDSILYVFEDYFSMLICIHSMDIEIFGLHELILYGLLVNYASYFWTDNMCRERPLVHALLSDALSGSFLTLFCRDISHTLSSPHLPFLFEL